MSTARSKPIAGARAWRQVNWYDKVPEQLDQALAAYAEAYHAEAVKPLVEALTRMLVHFAGQQEELCIECGEKIGSGKGCDTCYVLEQAESALAATEGK